MQRSSAFLVWEWLNLKEYKTLQKREILLAKVIVLAILFVSASTPFALANHIISESQELFLIDDFILSQTFELDNYDFRRRITIGQEVGAGTNYQIKLDLRDGTGSDSGNTIFSGGSYIQDDWDDITFTKDDKSTELDYWIESYNSNQATVWVEVADSLDLGDVDIYWYYGNSADSINDGDLSATFLTGTDGSSAPNTNIGQGSWSSDGDWISVSSYGAGGEWHGPQTDYSSEFTFSTTSGVRVRARWTLDTTGNKIYVGHMYVRLVNSSGTRQLQQSLGDHWGDTTGSINSLQSCIDQDSYIYTDAPTTDWIDWTGTSESRVYENSGTDSWFYIDDSQKAATDDEDHTYTAMQLLFEVYSSNPAPPTMKLDYVFVSKLISSEPTVDSVASPETPAISPTGFDPLIVVVIGMSGVIVVLIVVVVVLFKRRKS
ncbi:MAG: DUF2341 domain-containing protein [Candidatus Thorarchaeota archaeon]